jgi:hypothetical protein
MTKIIHDPGAKLENGWMPRRRTLLLALLLPLALAGCRRPAAVQAAPRPAVVYVAPGVPFRLCPPESGPDLAVTQEVVFTFPDGRRETTLATLQNRGGVFDLVASTPLGQTLFVIRLQGGKASVDARIKVPGDLDPRVLPALVQFALWPAEAVRAALGPGTSLAEAGPVRTLLRKDQPVWTVTREGDAPPYRRLALDNPAFGLGVRIRTLED